MQATTEIPAVSELLKSNDPKTIRKVSEKLMELTGIPFEFDYFDLFTTGSKTFFCQQSRIMRNEHDLLKDLVTQKILITSVDDQSQQNSQQNLYISHLDPKLLEQCSRIRLQKKMEEKAGGFSLLTRLRSRSSSGNTQLAQVEAPASGEPLKESSNEIELGLAALYQSVYEKALAGRAEGDDFKEGERTAVKHVGLAILTVLEEFQSQGSKLNLIAIGCHPKLPKTQAQISALKKAGIQMHGDLNDRYWSRLQGVVVQLNGQYSLQVYIDLSGTNPVFLESEQSTICVMSQPSFDLSCSFMATIMNGVKNKLSHENSIHVKTCQDFSGRFHLTALQVATDSLNNHKQNEDHSQAVASLLSPDQIGVLQSKMIKKLTQPFHRQVLNTAQKIDWFPVPPGILYQLSQDLPDHHPGFKA